MIRILCKDNVKEKLYADSVSCTREIFKKKITYKIKISKDMLIITINWMHHCGGLISELVLQTMRLFQKVPELSVQ